MATYIKVLKEDNDDIIYPQTKGSAVLLDGGSDLETVLAAKADASTVNQKITIGDVQSTDIVANAVTTAKIADSNVTAAKLASNSVETAKIANGAVTSAKIADNAVTQDKIAGGWKLIGEANGSGATNLPLYFDKIYKTGTFKVIAGGQCNAEGWVDLRAYSGSAVGTANLIHTSFSQVSFSDTAVNGTGSSADTANYIAAGVGRAYMAFSIEATSSGTGENIWRTWTFQFGCGTWGRFGTAREAGLYNKTAFSLDSQNPIYDAHIEVWWHE